MQCLKWWVTYSETPKTLKGNPLLDNALLWLRDSRQCLASHVPIKQSQLAVESFRTILPFLPQSCSRSLYHLTPFVTTLLPFFHTNTDDCHHTTSHFNMRFITVFVALVTVVPLIPAAPTYSPLIARDPEDCNLECPCTSIPCFQKCPNICAGYADPCNDCHCNDLVCTSSSFCGHRCHNWSEDSH